MHDGISVHGALFYITVWTRLDKNDTYLVSRVVNFSHFSFLARNAKSIKFNTNTEIKSSTIHKIVSKLI